MSHFPPEQIELVEIMQTFLGNEGPRVQRGSRFVVTELGPAPVMSRGRFSELRAMRLAKSVEVYVPRRHLYRAAQADRLESELRFARKIIRKMRREAEGVDVVREIANPALKRLDAILKTVKT